MRPLVLMYCILLAAVAAIGTAVAQEPGRLQVQLRAADTSDAAPAETVALYSRSYALVIGNDNYKSRSWPKLSNGIKDAQEVAAALTRHGFQVTLKLDLDADGLRNAIEDFVFGPGADKDARLLIWYAGHGNTVNDEGYLVPIDAPSPNADAEFRRKALSLRKFGGFMREVASKHVLAIFDSCFAGTVFDTARAAPPVAITRATTLPVRQMISSGEATQQVSDDGLFRRLFIDALDGKEPNADANRDGYITGSELGLFLADKVTNFSQNAQTPRYGKLRAHGFDRGDFVFRTALPQLSEPSSQAGPTTTANSNDAAQAWAATKDAPSVASLEAFIRRYGDTFYGDLAKAHLAELRQAEEVKQSALAKQKSEDENKRRTEQLERDLASRIPAETDVERLKAIASQWPRLRIAVQTRLTALKAVEDLAKAEAQSKSELADCKQSADVERSISGCTAVIARTPNSAEAYAARSRAYYEKKDNDRTFTDADKALKFDATNLMGLQYRGLASYRKGDYDRAIADFDQLLKLEPNRASAYSMRGAAYSGKGLYDRSIADYDQAVKLNPKNDVAYYNRGLAHAKKQDYDRAIADYSESLRLNPNDPIAHSARANAYNSKGVYDEAIADYDQAIKLNPTNASLISNRGSAYFRKKQYDRAMTDFDQAIKLDTSDAVFYQNRGRTHFMKGAYDRAIAEYEQAIKLNPSRTQTYVYRGEAYEKKPDRKRAIEDFRKALSLKPDDNVARDHLKRLGVNP